MDSLVVWVGGAGRKENICATLKKGERDDGDMKKGECDDGDTVGRAGCRTTACQPTPPSRFRQREVMAGFSYRYHVPFLNHYRQLRFFNLR